MSRRRRKKARKRRERKKKEQTKKKRIMNNTKNGKISKTRTSTPLFMSLVAVIIVIILLLSYLGYQNLQTTNDEKWTVMVYMAGDNSLSPQVQNNLNAMMEVGSGNNLDIVVLADSSGTKDSHLYTVKKNKLIDQGLNNIHFYSPGEIDTGNPRTLSDFGKWTIEHYPAERYMLIMWGHGLGWKGLATDKGGSKLDLSEFNSSLNKIVRANSGKKIDIIGFDACVMATMEGYFQISPYADYLVASQKKEPDAGWPYSAILKEMKEKGSKAPETVVKTIVRAYIDAYENGDLPDQGFSVGMTGIRTSEDSRFSIAFQRFAYSLGGLTDSEKETISNLRKDLLIFEDKDNVDFLTFVKKARDLLSNNPAFKATAEELISAAENTIIMEKNWNNPNSKVSTKGATGLCIYYPQGMYDKEYNSILMSRITTWDEFIYN